MASPPNNRRPGVDADILQANWVRGYDGPKDVVDPCDLLISNGRNEVDGRVADILVWNRTDDREQSMFILLSGEDQGTAAQFEVYAGLIPDPNGILTSPIGSIYISNNPYGFWQNTTGADVWVNLATALGGENLEETLAIGNFTGNNSIVISAQPQAQIIGEENNAGGDGAAVRIYGGTASGVTGDGGEVILTSGTTVGGNTGGIDLRTADILGGGSTGNTGNVRLIAGNTSEGGNGGGVLIQSGTGATAGNIQITAGQGANPGGDFGGDINASAGDTPADGFGGTVLIQSGSPGTPPNPLPLAIPGKAGWVYLQGGNSAGSQPGAEVVLAGGSGGPGGGDGGSILLIPGTGVAPGDDGIIDGQGVFQATNHPRGDGDPNVLGVSAPEGSLFQRTTGGAGEAWVNVDGTPTGWAKLLTSGGGIVNALTQIQWGSLVAGADDTNEDMDNFGVLHDASGNNIVYQESAAGTIAQGQDGTPTRFFAPAVAPGAASGVYVDTFIDRRAHFRATFKIVLPSVLANQRIFCGFTKRVGGNDITVQLATNSPGGDWFGIWKKTNETQFRFQAQGVGGDNTLSSVVIQASQVYYFAFDCFLDADGGVTAYILDDEYNILDQRTFSPQNSVFGESEDVRILAGTGTDGAGGNSIQLFQIALVTRTDLAEAAFAGGGGFSQPLSQVLVAGNETGGEDIIFTSGDVLLGEEDGGGGGSGGNLVLLGGATTNVAAFTGAVSVGSGSNTLPGFSGGTGVLTLSSGVIADGTNTATGNTGNVTLASGPSTGVSGALGDILIATGSFFGGGGGALATGGDIRIGANAVFGGSTNSVPGNVDIVAGTTEVAGITGGSIDITSGGNVTNGDSGSVTISSRDADSPDGSTGNVLINAGTAGTNSGTGGTVTIVGGFVDSANLAGAVAVGAGWANVGSGGTGASLSLLGGQSDGVGINGGDVNVFTGSANGVGAFGGDFVVSPQSGPGGPGESIFNSDVTVNGKLTVTGLIDPTGLIFDEESEVNVPTGAAKGAIFVSDGSGAASVANALYYKDSGGTLTNLLSGGAAGDLATVLNNGNATGPLPIEVSAGLAVGIKGEDSNVTDGGNLNLQSGSSLLGAGGSGGTLALITGTADTTGNTNGGGIGIETSDGGGTGHGGDVSGATGNGTGTGRGGNFRFDLGAGGGTALGGSFSLNAGEGGAGGGDGGNFFISSGDGNGGGNGGNINLNPGTGATNGQVVVNGDAYITGKLTVDGLIDPPGLLMTSSGGAPFTPVGSEGGFWVNNLGELIYENVATGSLNISTSIASGVGPLSSVLGAGNNTGANFIEIATTSPGIIGQDNGAGNGTDIFVSGGNSTGGGGRGGGFDFTAGAADTGGAGGGFNITLSPGDGTSRGGEFTLITGPGGATSGQGGDFQVSLGPGGGTGRGGAFQFQTGTGGAGGGFGGNFEVVCGDGGTGQSGGGFNFIAGASDGAAQGGSFSLTAGAGGGSGGAGDGGTILLQGGNQVGTGAYGGIKLLAGGTVAGAGVGDFEATAAPGLTTTEPYFIMTGGDSPKAGLIVSQAGDGLSGNDGGSIEFIAGTGDGVGNGGSAELTAGNGGATSGAGGDVRLGGGSALGGNGVGGDAVIAGGSGFGAGSGGDVLLTSGISDGGGGGDAGSVQITGGNGQDTGKGGDVTVAAGPSSGLAGSSAGSMVLRGGAKQDGTNIAGGISILGGDQGTGADTIMGGRILVRGGDLRTYAPLFISTPGKGGEVTIRGGASVGSVDGGNVVITGGQGGTVGASGASGGSVTIAGAAAEGGTNGNGGSITIRGGAGNGTGVPGQITLGSAVNGDTINFDSPAMKIGTFAPGAVGPGTVPIPYAGITQGPGGALWTPLPVPPRSIQITAESALGNVVTITLGSIVAPPPGALCSVDTTAGFGPTDVLHIVAYL